MRVRRCEGVKVDVRCAVQSGRVGERVGWVDELSECSSRRKSDYIKCVTEQASKQASK